MPHNQVKNIIVNEYEQDYICINTKNRNGSRGQSES